MRYFTRYARTMEQFKDWYDTPEIDRLYGDDADLFRRFLAATSQNCSVKTNLSLANKALQQYKNNEPFSGFLPQVTLNLKRIECGQPCTGPKISAFERAMTGDPDAIVVDLHMTELFFGRKAPTKRQREHIEDVVRKTSKKLKWEPRQTQASLWAYNFKRRGVITSLIPSYDKYLLEAA